MKINSRLRKFAQGYVHYCPGCEQMHAIYVDVPHPNGSRWTYNDNHDQPSFKPSVSITGQCHYYLTDGMLIFQSDCAHKLAGQTVHLPDLPWN